MTPMLDPRELWGNDSEIGKKITTESTFRRRFSYPKVEDKNKKLIFPQIAQAIAKVAKDNFVKGFLDLDAEWTTQPQLEPYRKQLLAQYPHPFSGFKLFFGKIQIKEIEEEIEDPTTKKKSKKKRVGIVDKFGNGFKLTVNICIFRNTALGWTEDWEKPPKIITTRVNAQTGAMEKVEEEGNPEDAANFKPTWKWKNVSGWISPELMAKVESYVEQFYKAGDPLPKELSVLVVGEQPIANGKFTNMEIGDVL